MRARRDHCSAKLLARVLCGNSSPVSSRFDVPERIDEAREVVGVELVVCAIPSTASSPSPRFRIESIIIPGIDTAAPERTDTSSGSSQFPDSLRAEPPSQAEAAEAVEPLLWLVDQLAEGVKLTQTGALPRALVRAAVERYPTGGTPTASVPHTKKPSSTRSACCTT